MYFSVRSGKTIFPLEFLARGRRRVRRARGVRHLRGDPTDIRRNAASLGFPIQRWAAERKWVFDASADIDEAAAIGQYDFGGLMARIEHAVRELGATRVALDSLGAVFARFTGLEMLRHELHRIASMLERTGITAVLNAERTVEHDGCLIPEPPSGFR
jgi:circadian clock protein KaiC